MQIWTKGGGSKAFDRYVMPLIRLRIFRTTGSIRTVLAIVFSILPLSMALSDTPTSFEGMTFKRPDASRGWVHEESPGYYVLKKLLPSGDANKREGKSIALIQVSSPASARSNSLIANHRKIIQSLPELAEVDPTNSDSGVTVNGYPIIVEHRCCGSRNGVKMRGIFVGIEGPRSPTHKIGSISVQPPF